MCQLSAYCPFTACCMETGQGPLNVFPPPPGTALSLVSRGPGETEEGVSSPLPACCPGGLLRHASLACPRLLAVRSASPASSGPQRPVVSSFPWLPLGGSVAHCLQRGICSRSLLQPPKGGVSSRFCWCSATALCKEVCTSALGRGGWGVGASSLGALGVLAVPPVPTSKFLFTSYYLVPRYSKPLLMIHLHVKRSLFKRLCDFYLLTNPADTLNGTLRSDGVTMISPAASPQ